MASIWQYSLFAAAYLQILEQVALSGYTLTHKLTYMWCACHLPALCGAPKNKAWRTSFIEYFH